MKNKNNKGTVKKTRMITKLKRRERTRRNKKIKGGTSEETLEKLYEGKRVLVEKLQDVEGRIDAIQTNQHFSSDKNPNSLEDNKKKIEKDIINIDKKIEKEEQKWNKYADKELNHIAEKGIINAIKRNKLGSKVVVGGGSVLLLGIIGGVIAIFATK